MDPQGRALFDGSRDVVGSWISIGHPRVVEAASLADIDFLLIDAEHTTMSLETIENLQRAASFDGDVATIVRVPWNDPIYIKRILDIGIDGIMAPMIETGDQARALVEAARYPPAGRRGMAGSRATDYGLEMTRYVEEVDDKLAVIAQIETEEAAKNCGEIASVDGVDSLFVGPTDLSASLGVRGDWEADRVTRSIDSVLETCMRLNIPAGTLALTTEQVDRWQIMGFDWLVVGTDTRHVVEGNERLVRNARKDQ